MEEEEKVDNSDEEFDVDECPPIDKGPLKL